MYIPHFAYLSGTRVSSTFGYCEVNNAAMNMDVQIPL